jgi:hypothetical protein
MNETIEEEYTEETDTEYVLDSYIYVKTFSFDKPLLNNLYEYLVGLGDA